MKTARVLAVAVVLLLVPQAAQAACGGNPLIQTFSGPYGSSFVWVENVFVPEFYPYYPPFAATPPWTPRFEATFWALGSGDPIVGPGDDAGIWTVPPYDWAYHNPTYYGYYHYAGSIFAGWGAHGGIDGCLQNNPPGSCTCVLLTDQDSAVGYFAIAGNAASAGLWWTQLDQPGNDGAGNAAPIVLAPIPKPIFLSVSRRPGTFHIDATMTVPAIPEADYTLGGCDCGPIGYRIVEQVIPRLSPPPLDRDATLWQAMTTPGGGAQPITPLGAPVTIESICGYLDNDLYIAAELYFDSGFKSPVVSRNSTRVECGPNLAEPEPPRFRPGSQEGPGRPTRERGR
jgi:hypothetical protein